MCEFVFFDSELSIKQLPVCRTDQIPLGTKGRTSILSVESSASCGASFPVSRRKLLDRACFVTSFRQGGYTPLRRLCGYPLWTCRPQTVLTNRSPPASLKLVNDNLTKERERMKKIMFGNSLMLLGIAIMILAGLKVIYVGTLWVSFLLIIVGFVMATIGFFGKDSK